MHVLTTTQLQAESAAGAMYGGNSGHVIVCVEGGPSRRRSSYEMQPSSFDVTATTCALQKLGSSTGSRRSSSSSSSGSKAASAARRKAFGSGSAVMSAWTAGTTTGSSGSMSAAAVAAAAAARQAPPVSFDPWTAAGSLQRELSTISHTV
jgi:hypothetical protein